MPVGDLRYAALVAPAIDRAFRSALRTVREKGGYDLATRHGGPTVVGPLIWFRHSLLAPDRLITWTQFEAAMRYEDLADLRSTVDNAVKHGMLSTDGSGLRATDAGRDFLREAWAGQDEALGAVWAEHTERVDRVAGMLGRLVEAATPTGGEAFGAMTPTYEPPGATSGARVLNRLGIMRYHRADAHAAAWSAAGLTAAGIQAMPAGPERDAIEVETNARAALPYAALPDEERLLLLSDLASLP